MTKNKLVNAKNMILLANERKFAIPHININNLEWIQGSLKAAQLAKSPIILGVSEGAAKYMGGYKLISNLVQNAIDAFDITIPVCLHLDHGTYDGCLAAIESGFTSIMFDGSHLTFSENLEKTKELINICKQKNLSIEVEVGTIGGYEDGATTNGELANINECVEISKLDIDFLAAGIGNIHGLYPENWTGIDFNLLCQIVDKTKKAIVLHGGSGIPNEMVQKAIEFGIRKINVNTECQVAFSSKVKQYFEENSNIFVNHNYDPRKYLKLGIQAIVDTCLEKMELFHSKNTIN